MANVFEWLPKPGETIKIPGGFIVCESYKVSFSSNLAEGSVHFRFVCDQDFYRKSQQTSELLISNNNVLEDKSYLKFLGN